MPPTVPPLDPDYSPEDSNDAFPTLQGAGSSAKVRHTLGSDPPPRQQQPPTHLDASTSSFSGRRSPAPSSWRIRRKDKSFEVSTPPNHSSNNLSPSHAEHDADNNFFQMESSVSHRGKTPEPLASTSSLTLDRLDFYEAPATARGDHPTSPRASLAGADSYGNSKLEDIVPWVYEPPPASPDHTVPRPSLTPQPESRRRLRSFRSTGNLTRSKDPQRQGSDKVPWIKRLVSKASSHDLKSSRQHSTDSLSSSKAPTSPPLPFPDQYRKTSRADSVHSYNYRRPSDGSSSDPFFDSDWNRWESSQNFSHTHPSHNSRSQSGKSIPSEGSFSKIHNLRSSSRDNRGLPVDGNSSFLELPESGQPSPSSSRLHHIWQPGQKPYGNSSRTLNSRKRSSGSEYHTPPGMGFTDRSQMLTPEQSFPPNAMAVGTSVTTKPMVSSDWAAPESWSLPTLDKVNADGGSSSEDEGSHLSDLLSHLQQDVNGSGDLSNTGRHSKRPSSASQQQVMHTIRIFKPDLTHTTLLCPISITAAEVQALLIARKPSFITSMRSGCLYIRERGLERELGGQEKPILIQKRRLEQAGYQEHDRMQEIERQDNSYLYKFIYRSDTVPVVGATNDGTIKSFATVDLSSRGLHTIPIFLYRHSHEIIVLNLSRNFHFDLPKDFVQSCTSLRDLRVTDCALKRVPANVLHFPYLTMLDLSQNRISDLSHCRISHIPDLISLKVYGNRLFQLPDYFSSMQSLKYLDISNNRIDVFPPVLCELSSLVDLDISFNNLTAIPKSFAKMRSLERFFCVGNSISEFPSPLDELMCLREVDIRRNSILDISVFAQLPKLQVLKCDHNSISSVNVKLSKLDVLEASYNPISSLSLRDSSHALSTLDLSNAKLSTIKEDVFKSLKSVRALILDHNSFRSIDDSLCDLTALRTLSIKNNGLASLPDGLEKLTSLQWLDISGNNIANLPSSIWSLGSLTWLNGSSNLLRDFPSIPPPSDKTQTVANTGAHRLSTSKRGRAPTLFNSTNVVPPVSAQNLSNPSYAPLCNSLERLSLADNSLTDEACQPISLMTSLEILNLSFNDLYELPSRFLSKFPRLTQLYVSGNKLTTLPEDDFEALPDLEVLFLNANKLQTLPIELGLLKKLRILDVGSNVLKYNIANYRFDWNWNWNPELAYLNLSGNKRLEIKPPPTQNMGTQQVVKRRNLADFDSLHKMRVLGLIDVTLVNSSIPDGTENCRVRTSLSDINDMAYGIADCLAVKSEYPNVIDLAVPRFRGKSNEALLGLFDVPLWTSLNTGGGGTRISMYLQDCFAAALSQELGNLREGEDGRDGFRRAFLSTNRDYGNILFPSFDARRKESGPSLDRYRQTSVTTSDDVKAGATGVVIYIVDKRMYIANAGDALAVLSRRGGAAESCTTKHDTLSPENITRVRASDGWLTTSGLVNNEVDVARAFGYYHVFPVVSACPDVKVVELNDSDEFVILGNRGLWDYVSEQGAVDAARTERADPMVAAQKLRDLAISYGSKSQIMVMILSISDLFQVKTSQSRNHRGKGSLESTDLDGYMAQRATTRRGLAYPGERYLTMLDREVAPPTGVLSIVFTDIRNSTRLWETNPGMHVAMRMHNQLLRRQLRAIGGYEVKTEGDAFMCSFPTVLSALLWCFTVQVELVGLDWPQAILNSEDGKPIKGNGDDESKILYRGLSVRMGIHWGSPVCEPDPITRRMDYFGPMVNRASRIQDVADGGQIAASADAANLIKSLLNDPRNSSDADTYVDGERRMSPELREQVKNVRQLGLEIFDVGEHRLKGLETSETISLFYPTRLAGRHIFYNHRSISGEIAQSKPTEIYKPTPQLLDPLMIRHLGTLCLRLEYISSLVSTTRRTNNDSLGPRSQEFKVTHPHSSMEHYPVNLSATDDDMMAFLEEMVIRIENAMSTLVLHELGPFTEVLSALNHISKVDPQQLLQFISMYARMMNE